MQYYSMGGANHKSKAAFWYLGEKTSVFSGLTARRGGAAAKQMGMRPRGAKPSWRMGFPFARSSVYLRPGAGACVLLSRVTGSHPLRYGFPGERLRSVGPVPLWGFVF